MIHNPHIIVKSLMQIISLKETKKDKFSQLYIKRKKYFHLIILVPVHFLVSAYLPYFQNSPQLPLRVVDFTQGYKKESQIQQQQN
jgi:hypothetical protein